MIENNSYFIKYNANPKDLKTGDCVIRALSKGLNKSWDDILKELFPLCLKWKRLPDDRQIYRRYLKKLGYEMEKMPRKDNNTRYPLKEFINELAKDDTTYIINVAKHLTVVQNKKLYDTWDCSKKYMGNYWIIK